MTIYADEIIADSDFGPAMQALEQQKQRFVLAILEQRGQPNFSDAARQAGYSDHPGTSRVTGHALIHQPKVIAALHEESRRRFTLAGWQGVLNLIKIAEDDKNKNHFKASKELADRFGYAAVTEHRVQVAHTDLTGDAILSRIRALAAKHGIPESKLIGGNVSHETQVIDVTPEAKTDE